MPNSAFLSASDPEDIGAWESDILCLAFGYEGLRRVRPQILSFQVCIGDDLDHSLPHEAAASDSSLIFSLSPSPSLFLLFVWIVLAHTALRGW